MKKVCSICNEEKDLSEFHKSKMCLFGVDSRCKICRTNRKRLSYNKSEKQKENKRRYYKQNANNIKKYHRKYRSDVNYKIAQKNNHLKRYYGITIEDFNKILTEQNNKCAACGDDFNNVVKPHVDHNHKTEEVRGLLCMRCNTSLGLLQENERKILNLAKYAGKISRG